MTTPRPSHRSPSSSNTSPSGFMSCSWRGVRRCYRLPGCARAASSASSATPTSGSSTTKPPRCSASLPRHSMRTASRRWSPGRTVGRQASSSPRSPLGRPVPGRMSDQRTGRTSSSPTTCGERCSPRRAPSWSTRSSTLRWWSGSTRTSRCACPVYPMLEPLLSEAESRGLFVTRLGSSDWYEIHTLVRERLRR